MNEWLVRQIIRVILFFNWLSALNRLTAKHISVEVRDWKMLVRVTTHDEWAAGRQKKLDKIVFRPEKFKEQVMKALTENKGADYFCFSAGTLFVQFGAGSGELILDLPLWPTNGLPEYKYQLIGLLAKQGFLKTTMAWPERLLWWYFDNQLKFQIMKDSENREYITANFRKNYQLAAEYVNSAFQEVFKEDLGKVKVWVG